ncbi:MAG: peptidylprolyl isomerase [Acidobacteria bacterium]|nr:MAG: peptidylprolyl isomerase [Acidobacteriota bacterium]
MANDRFAPLTAALAAALVLLAMPLAAGEAPAAEPATEEVCVLDTTLGTMVFRFFDDKAPRTTAQIKRLVKEGFYDGKPFYRVVAGHVIQAGDGGANDQPTVPGEFGAYPHVVGAVGLARDADPDSGSTEIYICLAPRHYLDGSYAVFGLLIEGFDVLERIGQVEVEERFEGRVAFHKPKVPVIIERAYLERRPLPP